jgi:hypothetical protein
MGTPTGPTGFPWGREWESELGYAGMGMTRLEWEGMGIGQFQLKGKKK